MNRRGFLARAIGLGLAALGLRLPASPASPTPTLTVTFSEITLRAKKLTGFIRVPNELLRYSTSTAEVLCR